MQLIRVVCSTRVDFLGFLVVLQSIRVDSSALSSALLDYFFRSESFRAIYTEYDSIVHRLHNQPFDSGYRHLEYHSNNLILLNCRSLHAFRDVYPYLTAIDSYLDRL